MGFSYFRNVLHKIPRPLFPPPPQREHRHSFPQLTCEFLEGERGCMHIALYPARETPPVFPLPPGSPPSLPGSRASPAAETTAPAPALLNRPQPAGAANRNCTRPGEGNTQNRHSNSQNPEAPTEIFNSPLNLHEKGNCPAELEPLTFDRITGLSANISEYLANSPFYSCFLPFSRVFYSSCLFLSLLSR